MDELKDYQRQQELWINYHKKLRAEQAPPNVLLEQKLLYREMKFRQKIDSSVDDPMKIVANIPGDSVLKIPEILNDFFPNTLPNHLQSKLNAITDKDGKTLLDFYLELERQQLDNDIGGMVDGNEKDVDVVNDGNKKQLEKNNVDVDADDGGDDVDDDNDDRKNRIKKLLANRVVINNHEDYLSASNNMQLDLSDDDNGISECDQDNTDTDDEDSNKSDHASHNNNNNPV